MADKTITVTNIDGQEEQVNLVFTVTKDDKEYLLYKNKNGELFASYMLDNDDSLHNDLTDNEYAMLEDIYQQGYNND